MVKLEDRSRGYEFSSIEHTAIFEKENRGFVRIRKKGMFYLDPSPWKKNLLNEIFVVKAGTIPPTGKMIDVIVSETEPFFDYNPVTLEAEKLIIKYIIGWQFVDLKKELKPDKYTTFEVFRDHLAMPFTKHYSLEDLTYCMALWLVSAPQLNPLEKGGIYTAVLADDYIKNRLGGFKRITSILPTDFKLSTSANFYQLLHENIIVNPKNSVEVNLAYLNVPAAPVHIPMAFDVMYKPYKDFKEDFEHYLPYMRTFILNSLFFQPEIPEKLDKKVEEAIYRVFDMVTYESELPYCQDIGSGIPKITAGITRLQFNSDVSSKNLDEGLNLFETMFEQTKRNIHSAVPLDILYTELMPDERRLYTEIKEMWDTGTPTTPVNILQRTSVPEWRFEEVLNNLKTKMYVIYKSNGMIKPVNY